MEEFRFGLAASVSSMDANRSYHKDVTDCAIVLNAIAGNDTYDPHRGYQSSDYLQALKLICEGAKLVYQRVLRWYVDKDVKEAILNAVKPTNL